MVARRFVLLISVMLLAACAQKFTADVTQFHALPAPDGETFVVVPGDKQTGSLEFQQYADRVASELEALGFRRADRPDSATYAVEIAYAVTTGREVTGDDSPVSVGVGVGGGSRGTSVGIGTRFSLGGRDDASVALRRFDLIMRRKDPGETVFEGHVTSEGRTRDLSEVMPYMIAAMFENFPGESGTTRTVKIPVDSAAD